MFSKLSTVELALAVIALIMASALWFGWHYYQLPEPKGQMVAPVSQISVNQSTNQKSRTLLSTLDEEAFAAVFGLQFNPPAAPAKADKPEPIATETVKAPIIQMQPATEKAQPDADLYKAGYRLSGIIHEDGKSAAFVFIPEDRRTVVVREQAAGPVKIVAIGSRWVRLDTPDGTGNLELEGTDISPDSGSAMPKTPTHRTPALPKPQPDQITGPSTISDLINSRQLQPQRNRGQYGVSVNEAPPAIDRLGLRRGDTILGVDDHDFKSGTDAISKLGEIGQRPARLKVQRGKDTFYINVSPPERP